MSLLVGVLCEDGVVVGAARSGMERGGGGDDREPSAVDLAVVDRDVILASVGARGLGQRCADVVAGIRSDSRFGEWAGLRIAKSICSDVVDDFASTRCEKGRFGALVAFAAADGFQLCEFPADDFQPELKTPECWFAAMGPGRHVAEPFVAFLCSVFFADSRPGLEGGVFAATWVLDYAVGRGSGAAVKPGEIAVLTREADGMRFAASLLSVTQRADALAEVRAAEKHLAAFRRSVP